MGSPDTPRVLVVDDEHPIRLLLSRVLTRSGFEAVEAIDGQDAIEQLAAASFDAIVLDLMMPRLDGFGVIDHLAETQPGMVGKTVVVTAFPKAQSNARLQHLSHVLSKPFDVHELVTAVRDCVAR